MAMRYQVAKAVLRHHRRILNRRSAVPIRSESVSDLLMAMASSSADSLPASPRLRRDKLARGSERLGSPCTDKLAPPRLPRTLDGRRLGGDVRRR